MTHASLIRGRALTYGQDAALLATRAQLLEADGYTTDTVATLQELRRRLLDNPEYDIVVLCHSVSQAESEEVEIALQNLGKPLFRDDEIDVA